MSPRDWDAATYERVSAPLTAMGADVLDRLVLRGDETVLDAGCGTGGVTRLLHERLPRGRVIAVDAAPSMVAQARELLPAGVDVRQADLLELDLGEPVDAVFSTATFHWIGDHDRLFARLHAALAPGGRLVAQYGGHGNVAAVKHAGAAAARDERFARHFEGWSQDWTFATPEDTERRLLGAGFADVWCWLSRVDVDPEDPAGYLGAICLGSYVARLPEELREPFVAAALELLPAPLRIEYVRLNILARKPHGRRGDPREPRPRS
jgi:trans-aconitate 2-methyltransferase